MSLLSISFSILPFFEAYSEAVVILSDGNETLFVNGAFTKYTGYEKDKVDAATLLSGNKGALQEMKPGDVIQCNICCADGTDKLTRISVSPVQLEEHGQTRVYTLIDLTEIALLLDKVKATNARFEALADNSPAMIWLTNSTGKCYYFNKSWLNFTGRKLEEELNMGWQSGVPAEDISVFGFLQAPNTPGINRNCEYRLQRIDGTYRHIYALVTPWVLPDGAFGGYMASSLDITEMKLAQAELNHLNSELKRSNEELEQFAYVASHDLQEPLRMVNGYVQLIKKNIDKGQYDSLNDFMGFVTDGVSRMQALINDLLQYSRVNRKGSPFAPVELNEVMSITLSHLSERIKENSAIVNCGELPVVKGDTFQLIRLFQNLIDNAIKFQTPGVRPEIAISVKEQEKCYLFDVKDNGIGIESKFHNRIFAIFQRLHTRSQYEGTGIGLAVCKKIVERHGGEIWVESEPGKGSAFNFTIKK